MRHKLHAPKGRTGHVMCSASGETLLIDGNGHVEANQKDMADLLRHGFVPAHEEPREAPELPKSTFTQDFIGHDTLS